MGHASKFDMDGILRRPAVRLGAFLTTVITARHLLENGFHFPTYLLLAHIAVALILKAAFHSKDSRGNSQDERRSTSLKSITWAFLYTASISAGLICGYQSLQHVNNTTLWIIIFSLRWDSLVPINLRFLTEKKAWPLPLVVVLRCSTFLICVALLFLQDGNMSAKGEYLALGAIGSVLLAMRLWRFGETRDMTTIAGRDAHEIALGVSVVPTVVVLIPNEWSKSGNFGLHVPFGMLLVNVLAGASFLCGGVAWDRGLDDEDESSPCDGSATRWLGVSFCLGGLVELDNLLLRQRPATTTFGQWVAFVVASLATLDFDSALRWIGHLVGSPTGHLALPAEDEGDEDENLLHEEREQASNNTVPEQQRRFWSPLVFQVMLNGLVWIPLLHNVLMHRKLDAAYGPEEPTARFDIVVSRYDEPIDKTAEAVNSVLEISKVKAMNTTVLIYNKGESIDVDARFPLASNVIVRQRENVGREGENILSHTLNGSFAFGDHTLFMQAEPHELHWMVSRIRQYLVKDTGFLSLSYPGAFCSECDRPWDVSGWHEDGETIEDIFEQTNPGRDCDGLSLTYRAQFIVSRERMENIDHGALKHLRERLLRNERFGFSLERLWGMVFGCLVIASTCPSLLSGWMGIYGPGGVGDCQCMDGI